MASRRKRVKSSGLPQERIKHLTIRSPNLIDEHNAKRQRHQWAQRNPSVSIAAAADTQVTVAGTANALTEQRILNTCEASPKRTPRYACRRWRRLLDPQVIYHQNRRGSAPTAQHQGQT